MVTKEVDVSMQNLVVKRYEKECFLYEISRFLLLFYLCGKIESKDTEIMMIVVSLSDIFLHGYAGAAF